METKDLDRNEGIGKAVGLYFDNMGELYQYIGADKRKADDGKNSTRKRSNRFCRFTWTQTEKAFRAGWKDGVKKIQTITDKINAKIEAEAEGFSIQYDMTGDFVDVGRLMDGIPDHWGEIIQEYREKPSLTIAVNVTASYGIDGKVLENRGAAVSALIDQLRKTHIVRVVVLMTAKSVWDNTGLHIEVAMDTNNDYSRDLLAFYLAHPGFFRRVCFAAMEDYFKVDHCGSYGTPDNLKSYENADDSTLYFPSLHGGYSDRWERVFKTVDSATAYVKETVEQYNSRGRE